MHINDNQHFDIIKTMYTSKQHDYTKYETKQTSSC